MLLWNQQLLVIGVFTLCGLVENLIDLPTREKCGRVSSKARPVVMEEMSVCFECGKPGYWAKSCTEEKAQCCCEEM